MTENSPGPEPGAAPIKKPNMILRIAGIIGVVLLLVAACSAYVSFTHQQRVRAGTGQPADYAVNCLSGLFVAQGRYPALTAYSLKGGPTIIAPGVQAKVTCPIGDNAGHTGSLTVQRTCDDEQSAWCSTLTNVTADGRVYQDRAIPHER